MPFSELDLYNKIAGIVSRIYNFPQSKVRPHMHLSHDLNGDRLDKIELSMMVTDQFGIPIMDAELEKIERVSDLVEFVKSRQV